MIRVLLVDDHALFRQGLRELLADAEDIRVVAEAGNYSQAVDQLRSGQANVVITDLAMPGRDGIDLLSHIRSSSSSVAVLVLTMHENGEHAARALRHGASGYITKSCSAKELISAVRRVASGRSFVAANVSENLVQRYTRTDSEAAPHTLLSKREFRIFELLVNCQTTSRIARDLSLSATTVSTHKARILKKLGLTHQGELVRYAIEHQLLGH
jgi:two-component system, NarL family, invasion response regulator UvrY